METAAPVAAAPAPAPAAAPAQSNSALSANNIVVTLFTGIVTGLAIGLGFILAQKIAKKSVTIESKSDSSSANGQQMPMYPPRMPMGRPTPMGQMPMGRPMPMGYNGGAFMQANGSGSFDANSWLISNSRNITEAELLLNAPD